MNDFEGLEFITLRLSFYPRISNGTNNLLRMELKSGETIVTFFKSNQQYDYEKLRPFIIALINNDLLTIDEGQKILRLTNDYEICKLKSEVNKRKLN